MTAYSRFSGTLGLRTSLWGSLAGEPPGIVREPRTIQGLEQVTIGWNSVGITPNEVVYLARLLPGPGQQLVDSLWREDRPLVVAGDAVPGLSDPVRFVEPYGVGCLDDGTPYFAVLTGDPATNTVSGSGIYLGDPAAAVYLSGPTQPIPALRVGYQGAFGFSEDGARSIARIELDDLSTRDTLIAMDGAPLVLEGGIVREGQPYPPSFGLASATWGQLHGCDINRAGHYYFREYGRLVRDGQLAWSAGNTVDGDVLGTRLLDVSMNTAGTIAHLWGEDQPSGPGGYVAALFLEDQLVLRRGDHVDWDGDGVRDPWARVIEIEGTIALGPDEAIYATARSRVDGVLTTALLRIANGSVGRFVNQIRNLGPAGEFLIPVDLHALLQPLIIVPALAGQTWYFTAWFRDATGAGVSTSIFTSGLELTFR